MNELLKRKNKVREGRARETFPPKPRPGVGAGMEIRVLQAARRCPV